MIFADREQMHHSDVFPGMMFYFVDNPNGKPVFVDIEFEGDKSKPWTVIHKEQRVYGYPANLRAGYWRYLLLGPGPSLLWHNGTLGWIRRVADPYWESINEIADRLGNFKPKSI